ncbi:hypothetical protein NITHO_4200002 [Nitrolancea hollandica Lb]|uniref:Uncharacterized protein n=1 Tax=Nitrolancea hollandica Lb TaxID=1129897 RepID=I4EJQ7_9BACT|nr:hypothetical protein NITHO_4200002 [Nitrolancea hollandica Lb]
MVHASIELDRSPMITRDGAVLVTPGIALGHPSILVDSAVAGGSPPGQSCEQHWSTQVDGRLKRGAPRSR